jgi:hypothetical protein
LHSIHTFTQAAAVLGNEPAHSEILRFCELRSLSPESFCNEFSIVVAKGFADGTFSYEYCDLAMNYLWGFINSPPVFGSDKNIPQPAFTIFDAFDAGEYIHAGDSHDVDSVEKYTRPLIDQILREINAL